METKRIGGKIHQDRRPGAPFSGRMEDDALSLLPTGSGFAVALRSKFRPIRARSMLAASGLAAHAFFSALMIVACVVRIVLLRSVVAHTPVSPEALRASDFFYAAVAGLHLLVAFFTFVAFLFWFHRAHQNLLAFRPEPLEHSAAEAVWSFFIPFVNLVKPYSVMKEIWVESDPSVPPFAVPMYAGLPSAPLVSLWWALFLSRGAAGWAALIPRRHVKTAATLLTTSELQVGAYAVSFAAAVMACLLVVRILRRQENLADQLTLLDRVEVF
jgi:hypothetical protein